MSILGRLYAWLMWHSHFRRRNRRLTVRVWRFTFGVTWNRWDRLVRLTYDASRRQGI